MVTVRIAVEATEIIVNKFISEENSPNWLGVRILGITILENINENTLASIVPVVMIMLFDSNFLVDPICQYLIWYYFITH